MWFDAKSALAKLRLEQPTPSVTTAMGNQLASDIQAHQTAVNVAALAPSPESQSAPQEDALTDRSPRHTTSTDAPTYFEFIKYMGPVSYGAAAMKLNWGATRAWQAQQELKEQKLINFDNFGRAKIARNDEFTFPRTTNFGSADL